MHAAPLFKSNTGSVSWHFTPFPRNLCLSQLPCAKDSPWDPWDPHQRSAAPGVPGLRLSWWARRRTFPSPTHTGLSLFYQAYFPALSPTVSACGKAVQMSPSYWYCDQYYINVHVEASEEIIKLLLHFGATYWFRPNALMKVNFHPESRHQQVFTGEVFLSCLHFISLRCCWRSGGD